MEEWRIDQGVLVKYQGSGSEAAVPEGVREIGRWAFRNSRVKRVVLPGSLQSIGDFSLVDCVHLEEIVLPSGLRSIGRWALAGCSALRQITVPPGVEEIGDHAFWLCGALEKAVLPPGLQRLGGSAFRECIRLRQMVLPEGLQELAPDTFSGCVRLEKICLPEGLRAIGDGCFFGCPALREVTLPGTVECIGDRTFMCCRSLQEMDLPEGMQQLGDYAFDSCSSLRQIRLTGANASLAGRLLRTRYPGVLTAPRLHLSDLEREKERRRALLGFVHAREEGTVYEDAEHWHSFGRREKEWLLGQVHTDKSALRWLLREQLLTRQEAQDLLAEADMEERICLLDYLHGLELPGEADGEDPGTRRARRETDDSIFH